MIDRSGPGSFKCWHCVNERVCWNYIPFDRRQLCKSYIERPASDRPLFSSSEAAHGYMHDDPRGNLQDCTLEETRQGHGPCAGNCQ